MNSTAILTAKHLAPGKGKGNDLLYINARSFLSALPKQKIAETAQDISPHAGKKRIIRIKIANNYSFSSIYDKKRECKILF